MDNYLYFRLGPYRVVIDAGSVLEIVDSDVGERQAAGVGTGENGHALWRGSAVASLDMMSRIEQGRCTHSTIAIVLDCSDGDRVMPLLLKVDEIYDVLTLRDNAFTPLPMISDTLRLYFDALYFREEEQAALLRMRASALWDSGNVGYSAIVG